MSQLDAYQQGAIGAGLVKSPTFGLANGQIDLLVDVLAGLLVDVGGGRLNLGISLE